MKVFTSGSNDRSSMKYTLHFQESTTGERDKVTSSRGYALNLSVSEYLHCRRYAMNINSCHLCSFSIFRLFVDVVGEFLIHLGKMCSYSLVPALYNTKSSVSLKTIEFICNVRSYLHTC